MRKLLVLIAFVVAIGLGFGGYVVAQDATPPAEPTPALCATPEATGSPTAVMEEASPVATPLCGTPAP